MQKIKITEISKVPYYGKKFPFIPWKFSSKIKVSFVFAKILYKKIGFLKFFKFWLIIFPLIFLKTYKKYKKWLKMMNSSFWKMSEIEWLLLIIIYEYLEKIKNKDFAYDFSKQAIQEASKFMMNDFYQADILKNFEDPFEAFWTYHKAMFKDDPNYPNEFIEEKDCKIMMVHDCKNCKIADLTIPDLAKLGCDHDITWYQAIADKLKMEFRRPQTIAKDNKPCKFMFFRKWKAPNNLETK